MGLVVGEETLVLARGEHERFEALGAAAIRTAFGGAVAYQV